MQALARFERIYRENFAFVWAAARRCGAPAQAFDGLVRDVFVSAFQRRDELPWEISERAWLYGITRGALAKLSAAGKAQGRPARDAAARRLEDVIGRLGDKAREVLVMAELLEMSAPEIASELQIPVKEVYRRLSKARGWLASELSEGMADEALAAVRREDRPPSKAMHDVWAAIGPTLRKEGAGAARGVPTPWTTKVFFGAAVVAFGFVGVSLVRSIDTGPEEEELEDLTALAGPSKVADASVGPEPSRLFGKVNPADERKLLEDADQALSSDRPSSALEKVQRHEAAFPNSPLSVKREVTRARALCRLGRKEEGVKVAVAVLANDPESSDGQAAHRECVGGTVAANPDAAGGAAAPEAATAPGAATPGAATPGAATPGGETPGAAPPGAATPDAPAASPDGP